VRQHELAESLPDDLRRSLPTIEEVEMEFDSGDEHDEL